MALTYTPKPGETKQSVLKHAEKVQNYLNDKDKVKTVQYSVFGVYVNAIYLSSPVEIKLVPNLAAPNPILKINNTVLTIMTIHL